MSSVTTPIKEDVSEAGESQSSGSGFGFEREVLSGSALAKRVEKSAIALVFDREALFAFLRYYRLALLELAQESSSSWPKFWTGKDLIDAASLSVGVEFFLRVPTRDDFVEIPTASTSRKEPVIKRKGIPVWVIVAYAQRRGMTPVQISRLWNGYITEQEASAALEYSKAHPESVEDKLSEGE